MVEDWDETFTPIDPGNLEWLELRHIREIATRDAEAYLESAIYHGEVAHNLVHDPGVTATDWCSAWSTMNDAYAFLLLLYIDHHRFNPAFPIDDPGKALRIFTEMASREGRLPLDNLLHITLMLHRKGILPKGSEVGHRNRRDRRRLFRP